MGDPGSSDQGGMIGGINVTPFVDVALVLLIIFLVTAKLVVHPASALPLTLPKAATGKATQQIIAVSLPKDGPATVNGQVALTDATLIQLANDQRVAHPDAAVVIQADEQVTHGRITHLMGLLSQARFTQISFAVVLHPESDHETHAP